MHDGANHIGLPKDVALQSRPNRNIRESRPARNLRFQGLPDNALKSRSNKTKGVAKQGARRLRRFDLREVEDGVELGLRNDP